MFSRRPHRKSRLGCKRCKTQRKKCDEVHPTCGHCRKFGVLCDFTPSKLTRTAERLEPVKIPPLRKPCMVQEISPITSSPVLSLQSMPQTHLQATSLSPSTDLTSKNASARAIELRVSPTQIFTPADRLLELRLFHHYIEMTSQKFIAVLLNGQQTSGRHPWTSWIISLSLSSPSLMDAILGLSAYHLRYLNASDKAIYAASHKYMARAIDHHARQLRDGINSENAEVIFATSAFIAFHSASEGGFLVCDNQGIVTHWFHPWQGIRAVLEVGGHYIQNVEIRKLVHEWQLDEDIQRAHSQQAFNFLVDDIQREELDSITIEAYRSSVAYLSKIYAGPLESHIFKFNAMVSRRFIELVAAQDPRSLTIVGYFFMLLKKLDRVWWLQGTAEREFKVLVELLPEEWKPRMDWAMREFDIGEV